MAERDFSAEIAAVELTITRLKARELGAPAQLVGALTRGDERAITQLNAEIAALPLQLQAQRARRISLHREQIAARAPALAAEIAAAAAVAETARVSFEAAHEAYRVAQDAARRLYDAEWQDKQDERRWALQLGDLLAETEREAGRLRAPIVRSLPHAAGRGEGVAANGPV